MPEDNIECEAFTMISINSLLLFENKYYSFVLNCKGEVVKWKSLGEKTSSSFNYCKRMTCSLPPPSSILRNLENFPLVHFIRPKYN